MQNEFEAEVALLGALLTRCTALKRVRHIVAADDFAWPINRAIFAAIISIVEAGQIEADAFVTLEQLQGLIAANITLHRKGGGLMTLEDYYKKLLVEATTTWSSPKYAKMVREFADRRRAIAEAA